jgi:NO-binding membrane sensor protein with MHYT domain
MDMNMDQVGSSGWLLLLAYLTSVAGCATGLACTMQARYADNQNKRLAWLGLAAVSIGGVGIWLMHFIAMLGFTTPGHPVRYSLAPTIFSAVLAAAAVFAGLVLFGMRRNFSWWRLAVSGLIVGVAVNVMHYTGMAAVRIKGTVDYNPVLVATSVVIAVVAATVALWFTVSVDHPLLRVLAGAVMGVAVTGMHYTGMAAMRVHLDMGAPDPTGVEGFNLVFPVLLIGGVALAVPICASLIAPTTDELEELEAAA